MRKLLEDKRRFSAAVFLVILCLIFFRFCYYGFTYYWQGDDYIQFYDFAHRGPRAPLIASMGLLSARPLAGLGDMYFWSNFSGCMMAAVLLVSAMFAASAVLFWRVLNKRFGTGPVFLVVYTLMPIAFEGTYWLSASTRIVTGLFFASLALYFFCRYLDSGGRARLIAYLVCMVISCGFYEQVLVFSVTAVLLFALLEAGKKNRRALWGLFAVAAMGAYFVYISVAPESPFFGKRMGITLPFRDADYFTDFLPTIAGKIEYAALTSSWSTIARGGMRGLRYIIADGAYLYLGIAVVLAAALAALFWRRKDKVRRPVVAIVVALLLTLAPVTPFFILRSGTYGLRCVTASLCGFALLTDTLLSLIFARRRSVMCVIAAVLAVGMSICTVSELHDYREITLMDNKIASLTAERLTADGLCDEGKTVCLINIRGCYLDEQNYYRSYLRGCTESRWAMSGLLECYMGPDRPMVTPLSTETWLYNKLLDEEYDASYLYNGQELIRVSVVKTDTGWELFDTNGELAAVIDFSAYTLTLAR